MKNYTPEQIDNLINNAKRKGINSIDILDKVTRKNNAEKFVNEFHSKIPNDKRRNFIKILVQFQKYLDDIQ
tara:strand:- start:421 stop:633 length:213 start_codon:yes stop_codon:yes gene_type:complete